MMQRDSKEGYPFKKGWGDLECDPDEGGQTSYYSGEVTGITQVMQLMHNQAGDRPLAEGLEHTPKAERIFEFDTPEPVLSRLRRIGSQLVRQIRKKEVLSYEEFIAREIQALSDIDPPAPELDRNTFS